MCVRVCVCVCVCVKDDKASVVNDIEVCVNVCVCVCVCVCGMIRPVLSIT
jgi:hypothetical protein